VSTDAHIQHGVCCAASPCRCSSSRSASSADDRGDRGTRRRSRCYGGRHGLVRDQRTGYLTATLRVVPTSTWLADTGEAGEGVGVLDQAGRATSVERARAADIDAATDLASTPRADERTRELADARDGSTTSRFPSMPSWPPPPPAARRHFPGPQPSLQPSGRCAAGRRARDATSRAADLGDNEPDAKL
jgi:hypothetical protein